MIKTKLYMKLSYYNNEMDEKERENMSSSFLEYKSNKQKYECILGGLKKNTIYDVKLDVFEGKSNDEPKQRTDFKSIAISFETLKTKTIGWKWNAQAQSSYQNKNYYRITNNNKTIRKVENSKYIYNMRMDPWISKRNYPNEVITVTFKVVSVGGECDDYNAIGVMAKSSWNNSSVTSHLFEATPAICWRIRRDGLYKNNTKQCDMPKLLVNQLVSISINCSNNNIKFEVYNNQNANQPIKSVNATFEAMENEEICVCIATRKIGWEFIIIDK
eukprot:186264_1